MTQIEIRKITNSIGLAKSINTICDTYEVIWSSAVVALGVYFFSKYPPQGAITIVIGLAFFLIARASLVKTAQWRRYTNDVLAVMAEHPEYSQGEVLTECDNRARQRREPTVKEIQ